jgi:hypothetical protein
MRCPIPMPLVQKPAHITRIIRAALVGSDRCDAEGLTAHGHTPVLQLCRILIAAGFDPGRPLHAYRGDVLCLTVRTMGEGARLTVRSSGNGCPIFCPVEGAAAPAMREYEQPLPTDGAHQNRRPYRRLVGGVVSAVNCNLEAHTTPKTLNPGRHRQCAPRRAGKVT